MITPEARKAKAAGLQSGVNPKTHEAVAKCFWIILMMMAVTVFAVCMPVCDFFRSCIAHANNLNVKRQLLARKRMIAIHSDMSFC